MDLTFLSILGLFSAKIDHRPQFVGFIYTPTYTGSSILFGFAVPCHFPHFSPQIFAIRDIDLYRIAPK